MKISLLILSTLFFFSCLERKINDKLNQAEQFLARGNYIEAVRIYEETLDLNEADHDLRIFINLKLARIFKQFSDYTGVLAFYKKIEEIPAYSFEAKNNIAEAYYYIGDFSKSIYYFESLLNNYVSANTFKTRLNLAKAYFFEENPDESLSVLKSIAKSDLSVAEKQELFFYLGESYYAKYISVLERKRDNLLDTLDDIKKKSQENFLVCVNLNSKTQKALECMFSLSSLFLRSGEQIEALDILKKIRNRYYSNGIIDNRINLIQKYY